MAPVDTQDGLLTVAEVARDLRVSRHSVYRRVHDGTLPALRIGRSGPLRFEPAAVQRVLKPAGPTEETA